VSPSAVGNRTHSTEHENNERNNTVQKKLGYWRQDSEEQNYQQIRSVSMSEPSMATMIQPDGNE